MQISQRKKLIFMLAILEGLSLYSHVWGQPPAEKPHEYLITHEVKEARFFTEHLGYAFTATNSIFKYENGSWTKIPLPLDVKLRRVFFVLPDMIWATYQRPSHYREEVIVYHRGRWSKVEMPHIDQLLDMAFLDEEHGWAAGQWGELLKYVEGRWIPMRSPTRCHIQTIVLDQTGLPMITTDCQFYNQVFSLQENGEWRPYPELESLIIYRIWPVNRDYFYFLAETTRKLFLYRSGEIIQIPIEGVQDFAFHPPDSLYLLANNTLYLVKNTTQHQFRAFTGIIPRRLALSQDGVIWVYSGINGIYPVSVEPGVNLFRTSYFSIQQFLDLGNIIGAAFLRLDASTNAIYVVHGLMENMLLLVNDELPFWILDMAPAEKFGLREPMRTESNKPNYDLAALTGDFNNDGLEDALVVGFYGKISFFLNLGDAVFKDVSSWAGFKENPRQRLGIPAAADVDNDGDLDLFIPNEYGQPLLMINNGVGRFTNRANESGLDIPLGSKAGSFADIDGDGWMDLAVATYGEGTYLYRNNGDGTFRDIRDENPVLQPDRPEKCPSLTFADYDNDGDFDLFIAKLYYPNQLLQNDGTGHFVDVTLDVGLFTQTDTRGAIFFDYDLDGDLDIFMANMGLDEFYEMDEGIYRLNEEFGQIAEFGWLPRWVSQALYGEYTTGVVKMDLLQDGDLDLLVLSFDHESYLLRNHADNSNYLVLEVTGLKSNRSAIGAVAELYPEGKAGDPAAILATQMLESISGHTSQAQKILHFGVDGTQKYDVVVRFPGGAIHTLRSLSPGRYYHIREFNGFYAHVIEFKTWLENQIYGYRANWRILQFVLLTLMIYGGIRFWVRRNHWFAGAVLPFGLAVVLGFLIIKITVVFHNDTWFVVAPLAAGTLTGVTAMQAYKLWRLNFSPAASLELLSLKLAAFGHSQASANLLSSLEFQLSNYPKGDVPWEFQLRVLQKIEAIREQVIPDILIIIEHLMTLKIARNKAAHLLKAITRFQRGLGKIHRRMKSNKPIRDLLLNRVLDQLQAIRTDIRELREFVLSQEICDVVKETRTVVQTFEDSDLDIVLHLPEKPRFARIPITEYRSILNELIMNAYRAMQDRQTKRVTISIEDKKDAIWVEVEDHGKGIPESQWEKIFERNVSDRQGGGFGLYHARYILEQFDGKIAVKSSQLNQGTSVQIRLRKALPTRTSRFRN